MNNEFKKEEEEKLEKKLDLIIYNLNYLKNNIYENSVIENYNKILKPKQTPKVIKAKIYLKNNYKRCNDE